jgi:predicted restriction endonuclease
VAKTNNGFKSAAHRAAVFATDPALGRNIASKYGAKVGGGFTKAQLKHGAKQQPDEATGTTPRTKAMKRACPRCGKPTTGRYCPAHNGNHTGWSPNRDRARQAAFRTALIAREDGRCQICGTTQDLRACHIIPLSRGGTYDPTNGRLLCKTHDKATDPYAR